MKLNFQLHGVDLQEAEAKSLLKIQEEIPAITIDLATVLDRDVLDAKKLFNLSIEKQRPELATLAAKLAIQKPFSKVNTRKPSKERVAIPDLAVEPISLDEALEKLCGDKNLMTAGAAMVLSSLAEKNNRTMREIAVEQVNKMWRNDVNVRSTIFNGFTKINGVFAPFIGRAGKGVVTYHSSPLYNSLREGSAFLVKSGFAVATGEVSFGSENKKLTGSEPLLRRVVYRSKLTEHGSVLADTWADVDQAIFNYWNDRLN